MTATSFMNRGARTLPIPDATAVNHGQPMKMRGILMKHSSAMTLTVYDDGATQSSVVAIFTLEVATHGIERFIPFAWPEGVAVGIAAGSAASFKLSAAGTAYVFYD